MTSLPVEPSVDATPTDTEAALAIADVKIIISTMVATK
jgi:hypothetical protein